MHTRYSVHYVVSQDHRDRSTPEKHTECGANRNTSVMTEDTLCALDSLEEHDKTNLENQIQVTCTHVLFQLNAVFCEQFQHI